MINKPSKKWTIRQTTDWVLENPLIKTFIEEGKDIREMVNTFSILLMEKLNIKHRHDLPTTDEVRDAIKQLKDVPKIMPLCVLFLMPIPGIFTSYTVVSYLIFKLSNGQVNILPQKFNIAVEEIADKKVFSFLKKKKIKD